MPADTKPKPKNKKAQIVVRPKARPQSSNDAVPQTPVPTEAPGLLKPVAEGADVLPSSVQEVTESELNNSSSGGASAPTLSAKSSEKSPAASDTPETSPAPQAGPPALPSLWFLRRVPAEGDTIDEEFENRDALLTKLKELVADKESLRGVRIEVLYGRRLGIAPFPFPYLQDGDEMLPLFTMPDEVEVSPSGYLWPEDAPAAGTPVAEDEEEELADEEEPETEEPTAEVLPTPSAESSATVEAPLEEDEAALAGAIAGAITPAAASGDPYGGEPAAS